MIRLALVGDEGTWRNYGAAVRRLKDVAVVAFISGTGRTHLSPDESQRLLQRSSVDETLKQSGEAVDAFLFDVDGEDLDREAVERERVIADAVLAVSAGKQVWIVGQRVGSGEMVRRLEEASAATGVPYRIANPLRYLPAVLVVKQSLESGKLGELGLVRLHRWHPRTRAVSPAAATVAELLRDELDLVAWLYGKEPEILMAKARSASAVQPAAIDYVQVHLGFPGGGMALLDVCVSASAGSGYFSLSAIGSKGAAYADDHHNMQLRAGGESLVAVRTGKLAPDRLVLLREFVHSVRERRVAAGTPPADRSVLRMSAAAEQSWLLGTPIPLASAPHQTDRPR